MLNQPKKVKEPLYTKLSIRNPKIVDILNTTAELGLFDDTSLSKFKYKSTDYESEAIKYCSIDFFKNTILSDPKTYGRQLQEGWTGGGPIKHKKNGFASSTPGGQYFIKSFEEITGLDLGDGSQPYGGFRSSVYNPDGFLSWHKDDGYGVYTIMLSYCVEEPDGFYRWMDNDTKEIHTEPDMPGWSGKSMVMIDEESSEWHTARSNTQKCSLVISFGDYAKFLKLKDLIQSDK